MFTCGVPRDLTMFERIVQLDQVIFGKNTLSPDRAKALFQKRPETYSIVLNRNEQPVAYLDVYPLHEAWASRLVGGQIGERDLVPDMLLDRADCHSTCHLYVGSVVVDNNLDPIAKAALFGALLKWRAFQAYSWKVQDALLLMCPVTNHGRKLMERLHAAKLQASAGRIGNPDLYCWQTTPTCLHRLADSICAPFNSNFVSLDLNFGMQRPTFDTGHPYQTCE